MCQNGKHQTKRGESECQRCVTGRFKKVQQFNGMNIDFECTLCQIGKYQEESGQQSCLVCLPGRYQDKVGQNDCTDCLVNYFAQRTSSVLCSACPHGRTSPISSASCSTCSTGRVQVGSDIASFACNNCDSGKIAEAGATVCGDCPAGVYQSERGQGTCRSCPTGKWSAQEGSTSSSNCLKCSKGTYSTAKGASSKVACNECPPGKHSEVEGGTNSQTCQLCSRGKVSKAGASVCTSCQLGQFTLTKGEASCAKCAAGRFGADTSSGGTECTKCPLGYRRAEEENFDLTKCLRCELGETTSIEGATSCSACSIGRYGSVAGNCTNCPIGQYQSDKKQTTCLSCRGGKIPNEQQTGCEKTTYKVPQDCDYNVQYLNNTATKKEEWHCELCPNGAFCEGDIGWRDVKALQGWWRVPWSEGNRTFERCPYEADCMGANRKTNANITERCSSGTTGPLCSLCVEGYNRNGGTCGICDESSVPMRVGIIVSVVLLISVFVWLCRRRVNKKWQMYRPLWRDFLRIVSINITFAQINSSLPYVLEVQWPPEWHRFVQNFAFVNIDLMSLLGISCIDDYNYYISFVFMVCLPVGILILAATNFHCAKASMKRKLRTLTDTERTNMEEEALHALFHLADADHSGEVDSSELAGILKALSWKVDVTAAHSFIETICKEPNSRGLFVLNEEQFLKAMLNGSMKELLEKVDLQNQLSVSVKAASKRRSKRSSLIAAKLLARRKNQLSSRGELIQWTLRKNISSNSLSGATQLLMLAHTPVSRKVFQYFDCNEMAGRFLLRADYNVNCTSNEYWTFLPAVLFVMVMYTIALPGVISLYLWRHRKALYSTSVYQTVGWLYEPFVRGAEFWQVHDVLMKMILTGMLIYVPSTSRAGIAVLVCLIATANLNYFQPRKFYSLR